MQISAEQDNKKSDDEKDRIKNWLGFTGPILIATHQDVDADAAFSAALLHILRPDAAIIFVRADSKISQREVLAVDLLNGTSSVKGLEQGSAFGLLVEHLKHTDSCYYNSLKQWAKQLNLTDQAESCRDSVILADLVNAWRENRFDDRKIVERARELLHGKLINARRQEKQKKLASKIVIKNYVAVLGPDNHIASQQLFRRGAKAVVRFSSEGMAVVLSKKARNQGYSLIKLKDALNDGWFIHPDGFLASFGGPKAPKCVDDAGITVESLTMRTKQLFTVEVV